MPGPWHRNDCARSGPRDVHTFRAQPCTRFEPDRCSCVQRAVGKVDAGCLREGGCIDADHLLGEPEVLGEVEVSGYFARRSRSSLSRSRRRLARWVKSLSARTRSISAESESTMS